MIVPIGKHKIDINPLTRGQIKALRKEGIELDALEDIGDDLKRHEEVLDKIFCYSCPKADTDALTFAEGYELLGEIARHTYNTEALKKKFGSRRRSSSRARSSSARNAKKRASRRKDTARKSKKKRG